MSKRNDMKKQKSQKREAKKKKRRYPQSGKSVFLIQKLRGQITRVKKHNS